MKLPATFKIFIAGGVWKVQSVAVWLGFLIQRILGCWKRFFARYSKSALCCWVKNFSENISMCPWDGTWMWGGYRLPSSEVWTVCLPLVPVCPLPPAFLSVMKSTCCAQLHRNVFLLELVNSLWRLWLRTKVVQKTMSHVLLSVLDVHIWLCPSFLFFYNHTLMIQSKV